MKLQELQECLMSAGVIGAGGAGFPTHKKLAEGIDTVFINASECEPLLYTDYVIMREHLDMVCRGAAMVREALGAKQAIMAVKRHTAHRLGLEQDRTAAEDVVAHIMPDAYPMGDEIVAIYQTLGRIVPPGQLPSSVGVVVINVETAYNIANAGQGNPVTEKWLTIGGDIPEPTVVRVPINCSVKAVLAAAGVTVPEGYAVIDGGPAMGNLISPATALVTKKTKALLVLPEEIPAVTSKQTAIHRILVRTPSACCQCMLCTDLCPRHLLGYPLQPHKTLRAAGSGIYTKPDDLLTASLCSGCGVCSLMACCQGILPSAVMTEVKRSLGKHRLGYKASEPTKVHSERDFRLVPISRLMSRIGVARFDRVVRWAGDLAVEQAIYRQPLSQHVGKPSVPIVALGETVKAGQMIAKADEGISAALHAAVSGTVTRLSDTEIEITVGEGL